MQKRKRVLFFLSLFSSQLFCCRVRMSNCFGALTHQTQRYLSCLPHTLSPRYSVFFFFSVISFHLNSATLLHGLHNTREEATNEQTKKKIYRRHFILPSLRSPSLFVSSVCRFLIYLFIFLSLFFFCIKCAYRPTRRHKHTRTLRTNITTK